MRFAVKVKRLFLAIGLVLVTTVGLMSPDVQAYPVDDSVTVVTTDGDTLVAHRYEVQERFQNLKLWVGNRTATVDRASIISVFNATEDITADIHNVFDGKPSRRELEEQTRKRAEELEKQRREAERAAISAAEVMSAPEPKVAPIGGEDSVRVVTSAGDTLVAHRYVNRRAHRVIEVWHGENKVTLGYGEIKQVLHYGNDVTADLLGFYYGKDLRLYDPETGMQDGSDASAALDGRSPNRPFFSFGGQYTREMNGWYKMSGPGITASLHFPVNRSIALSVWFATATFDDEAGESHSLYRSDITYSSFFFGLSGFRGPAEGSTRGMLIYYGLGVGPTTYSPGAVTFRQTSNSGFEWSRQGSASGLAAQAELGFAPLISTGFGLNFHTTIRAFKDGDRLRSDNWWIVASAGIGVLFRL